MNWWIPIGTTSLVVVGWISGYWSGRADERKKAFRDACDDFLALREQYKRVGGKA